MLIYALKITFLSAILSGFSLVLMDNFDKIAEVSGMETKIIQENSNKNDKNKDFIFNKEECIEYRSNLKKQKIKEFNNKIKNKELVIKKVDNNNKKQTKTLTNSTNTNDNVLVETFSSGFTEEEVLEVKNAVEMMMQVTMDLEVDKEDLDVCFKDRNVVMCKELIKEVLRKNYID